MPINPNWLQSQFPNLSSITPIGTGGQKSVFRAVQSGSGEVVLKVFHPNSDAERVRREMLAVQSIQSSRTPQIMSAGVISPPTGDLIWLIEQFISAPVLRETLNNRRLTDLEILSLAKDLIEVLAAAEDVNIVHRDVKPSAYRIRSA